MTQFTDLYIRRPVLASVLSLLILLVGLRALYALPIQEYPTMKNTVINVITVYPGADPQLMQGFITSPLEKAIAKAEGIDYMTSDSTLGVSTIRAYIKLNFDPNTAFTNIMSQVTSVTNQLPKAAQLPVITKESGSQVALMYIGFNSKEMTREQITEYISRIVQPKLQAIFGVSQVQILGGSTFAMRVWLNPPRMAALGITPDQVAQVLLANNFLSGAGTTKGYWVAYNINARTDLHNAEQFGNIIVKSQNGSIVRLKDIATVQLGSENYDSSVVFNGEKAVFIGITGVPGANPLQIINNVRLKLPELQEQFPPALKGTIVYDSTKYIRASITEVLRTIIEASVIVLIVIFLFLGSLRSVLIPIVTIPLSLIGVASLMLMLGFTINLLTLLALVLAIGLVVDDAIVVVENVHRHMEEGLSAFDAAIIGAREIATPVIAMTITLAAVYTPVGFMGGITGTLFKEFAFTLATSVIISGVIALTLSPMLSSILLTNSTSGHRFVHWLDERFAKLQDLYQKKLHNVLNYRPVTLVFAITILVSCYFLFISTASELAPSEDQGIIFIPATAPQYANIDYVEKFSSEFNTIAKSFPETESYFIVNGENGVSNIFAGMILKPWNERTVTQDKLVPQVQAKIKKIAGLQAYASGLPPLPTTGDNIPIQFVITTSRPYPQLFEIAQQILAKAKQSGLFAFVDNTLRFNQPQLEISVDQSKAQTLGISMEQIGNALAAAFGGNYLNYFSMEGQSYKVIPQVARKFRLVPEQLAQIYVQTADNQAIPLSTIVSIKSVSQPNSLSHFQQLNSAKIQGVLRPGTPISQGLDFLRSQMKNLISSGYTFDYEGQSRQYIQEGSALVYTFFFAIIIIFLVLAAQFESFSDPFVILVSVPMSICGALIFLNLGFATINIYTQVGLITLVGLITKHGILMVDFANHLQVNEGLSIREAIEKAAGIRLRPILMTTAAMVLGVLPLLTAKGAGAASRFNIGLVIATGMTIGTLFTLFVVPTMYTFLAKKKVALPKIQEAV